MFSSFFRFNCCFEFSVNGFELRFKRRPDGNRTKYELESAMRHTNKFLINLQSLSLSYKKTNCLFLIVIDWFFDDKFFSASLYFFFKYSFVSQSTYLSKYKVFLSNSIVVKDIFCILFNRGPSDRLLFWSVPNDDDCCCFNISMFNFPHIGQSYCFYSSSLYE